MPENDQHLVFDESSGEFVHCRKRASEFFDGAAEKVLVTRCDLVAGALELHVRSIVERDVGGHILDGRNGCTPLLCSVLLAEDFSDCQHRNGDEDAEDRDDDEEFNRRQALVLAGAVHYFFLPVCFPPCCGVLQTRQYLHYSTTKLLASQRVSLIQGTFKELKGST